MRGHRDLLPSVHALWPRLPAPFIEKRLSDHVKEACRLRDVMQRGPMVASVYVGGAVVGIFFPTSLPPRCPLARVVSAERELRGGPRRLLLQPRLRQLPSPSVGRRAAPGRGGSCGLRGRPDPRPASAPGGHAAERMSQRDTLVHLFAGGYVAAGACGLWLRAPG